MFKLNPGGNTLLYATYIGGRGDDRAAGIAVDSSGQVYIAGSTASLDFPLVSSIRPTLGGTRDAFVVKLNAIGNLLLYSTYLGGSGYDAAPPSPSIVRVVPISSATRSPRISRYPRQCKRRSAARQTRLSPGSPPRARFPSAPS